MSLRDKILGKLDRPTQMVHVPEWECDVWVRPVSVRTKMKIAAAANSMDFERIVMLTLLDSLCDESGKALFSESDVEALAERNGAVIDRLARLVAEANHLGADAVEQAKNG